MEKINHLLEIYDRFLSGPMVDEKEFDLKYVAAGVTRLIKKYGIQFDKDQIIQHEDDLIDRLWQAGMEFVTSCGVYHTDTGRVIQFTAAEIEAALQHAPTEVTIGEGADARVYRVRKIEDPQPPQVSGGPIGTPLSEDQWIPIMQSYWQEPVLDVIVPGTLSTVLGREMRTASPLEIVGAWHELRLGNEAAQRAGRPGLPRMCVEMAISDVGHLSSISRGGFRPTDIHLVSMIGEMKTNNQLLNKVAHSAEQNGVVLGFYNPILGGMAGPEEGVAILIVAGFLAMHAIYMPDMVESCPTHPFHFNSTSPAILRAVSAACTALARHTRLLLEFMTSPISGPCTASLLYECVGMAAVASACGASRVLGVRSAVGVVENHCTGLEARFNGEVAHAAAGLSREQANEIVKRAVSQYQPLLGTKPVGKSFNQAYDPNRMKPSSEWQAIYESVKEQVFRWGLPFK